MAEVDTKQVCWCGSEALGGALQDTTVPTEASRRQQYREICRPLQIITPLHPQFTCYEHAENSAVRT